MRSKLTLATLSAFSLACGTLLFGSGCATTKLTPGGAAVKVYETDRKSGAPDSTLPAGCRMLSAAAPFRQQASERVNIKDPYRADRNAAADRGGNVLLVRSSRIIELKKTECPTTDRSPDCQATDQSWYDVTLESYACDAPALTSLAELRAPTSRAFWWPFDSKTTPAQPAPGAAPAASATPEAATAAAPSTTSSAPAATVPGLSASGLKTKILSLVQEGVGTDVLVAYVKTQRVAAPLTAEEIVDWKRSGIAEPVIQAAIAQAPVH